MTTRLRKRTDTVLDAVALAALLLASAMLALLILIFSWLVFGRYVLNATPTWVEQLSLLLVVWITFLGAAAGVRHHRHLAVDFIREAMPRPIRAALTAYALIALGLFGAVMVWQGYVMFERTSTRIVPLLGVSEGWRAVPVILSGAMIAVFCADDLVKFLLNRKES